MTRAAPRSVPESAHHGSARAGSRSLLRGRIFLTSSGLLFGVSVGLQLLANEQIRRTCTKSDPDVATHTSIALCVAEHPGLVGMGVGASIGSIASIGLAAGAGWELGAKPRRAGPRRQRVLLALGSAALGIGVAGFVSTRIGFMNSEQCGDSDCLERQREANLLARNGAALLASVGAGLLTAAARNNRVNVQTMRLAQGAGINVTVRLP